MYGRRRSSRPPFLLLVVGVIVAAVIFVILDNPASPQQTASTAVSEQPEATAGPTEVIQVPEGPPPTDPVPTPAPPVNAASNLAALAPVIPEDTALFIPSAGIYARVVQAYLDGRSWDVSRLGNNVGHLQGTAWFTQPGNVVLSGHVELGDGRQGVFANLDDLQIDDIIVLTSNGVERRYTITEITSTTPDDLSPVMPTSSDRLTLITCDSYDFWQDAYLERIIIVAEPLT